MAAGHRKSRYFQGYVSEQGAEGLRNYKWAGSDDSLILNYITNPIYKEMIHFFPLWLAPNLITLAGLMCSWISYAVFFYYCPHLHGVAPWWAYLLNAAMMIGYQTLDALDGKQARRTGTSSPLGVLFDHGCDALNTTVSTLTMASVTQLGPGWVSFLFWGTATVTFYWATVEEYYTGKLRLGIINAPNEGLWIAAGLNVLTAIIGPGFWTQNFPGTPIPNNMMFLISFVVCGVATVVENAYHVVQAVKRQQAKTSADGKFSYSVAFTRLMPFYVVLACAFLWVLCSPTNVMMRHPRIVLWALGSLFSKLVTQLMLCHVCNEEYHPVGKTMSVFCFLGAHLMYNLAHQVELPLMEQITGKKVLEAFKIPVWADSGMNVIVPTTTSGPETVLVPTEDLVLYEFFVIATLSYLHFIYGAVTEVSTILGISCLTIPYPNAGCKPKDS